MQHSPQIASSLQAKDSLLQVYLLGSVDFEAALALQRLLVYQVSGDRSQAALVLCEHPPSITIGRQGSWAHIRLDPSELRTRGWPVRWVNRGGGCLLHLPGQLAIYSILSLDRLGLGLQAYLQQIQDVFRRLLGDFGLQSETHPDHAGVSVRRRPIAEVGVAVRDWVTYYGAAFNVNPSLTAFRHVRTSGLQGETMTSLERERRGPLRTALVRERLIEHFAARFGFAQTALFFDHPLLPRKAPADAVATPS
jgi:lipoyl(octanoyl) transferase